MMTEIAFARPVFLHELVLNTAGVPQRVQDGDIVRICAQTGDLTALVDTAIWNERSPERPPAQNAGTGRELFAIMRDHSDNAEQGASAMMKFAGL